MSSVGIRTDDTASGVTQKTNFCVREHTPTREPVINLIQDINAKIEHYSRFQAAVLDARSRPLSCAYAISDVERELSPGLDSIALYRLKLAYTGTWIAFFIQHPSATRKEILEVRDRLPIYNGQDRLPDFS
jgi:hypothetical protein